MTRRKPELTYPRLQLPLTSSTRTSIGHVRPQAISLNSLNPTIWTASYGC